jgi:hypothetical protein
LRPDNNGIKGDGKEPPRLMPRLAFEFTLQAISIRDIKI